MSKEIRKWSSRFLTSELEKQNSVFSVILRVAVFPKLKVGIHALTNT